MKAACQLTGLSPDILRAWERRYGLLRPIRSDGGFRLYSAADEERVRRMQANLAAGLSAAEAARLAGTTQEDAAPAGRPLDPDAGALGARPPALRRLGGELRRLSRCRACLLRTRNSGHPSEIVRIHLHESGGSPVSTG